MIRGIAYALSACFVWGLVFIIPQFVVGFSSIEIALGGYLFYGIISLFIFLAEKSRGLCNYSQAIWKKALFFSLMSTILYYTCVVLALRYSAPAICPLILGISPITIAFYGSWKEKESNFKHLILPSGLIFLGLIIINASHFQGTATSLEHCLGLLFSFTALITWSWFVVANAQFLKSNPSVASNDWSTLIGVTTFFWVIVFGFIFGIGFSNHFDITKYSVLDEKLVYFLVGCGVLGILCSWLGTFLWNKASFYLPVSLAGQLTIFETIFGLLFVYGLAMDIPPKLECFGVLLLLGAVVYGLKLQTKQILPATVGKIQSLEESQESEPDLSLIEAFAR